MLGLGSVLFLACTTNIIELKCILQYASFLQYIKFLFTKHINRHSSFSPLSLKDWKHDVSRSKNSALHFSLFLAVFSALLRKMREQETWDGGWRRPSPLSLSLGRSGPRFFLSDPIRSSRRYPSQDGDIPGPYSPKKRQIFEKSWSQDRTRGYFQSLRKLSKSCGE